MWLFTLGAFPPFEWSLDDYKEFSSVGYWDKTKFPLFGSGGGDYFLINCDEMSSTYSRIYFYSPTNVNFDGMITYFDSLESLILSVIESYQSEAYYLDESKSLGTNTKLERKIVKKYNPNSEYWKLTEV